MANQLWLFLNVKAYCLTKGYKLENHSFFEYSEDFSMKSNNVFINIVFFWPYILSKKYLPKRLLANQHDNYFRKFYKLYVKLVKKIYSGKIVSAPDSDNPVIHYLPPSQEANKQILEFDNNDKTNIYLEGWLFRNPVGIKKYHNELISFLKPNEKTADKIVEFVSGLRKDYSHIVGIHVRQGDYKQEFRNGELYFNEQEVKKILDEYLMQYDKNRKDTCFVIYSDGAIDLDVFEDLNVRRSTENALFDIFALASSDFIIGADSTFGALASYYGDIPFIVFNRWRRREWAV